MVESFDVTRAVVVGSLSLYRALLTGKGRKILLSRSSIGHYKDVGDGQTAVERKFSEDRSSRPGQPLVKTFRDGLDTQYLASLKYVTQGQSFSPARLAY